MKKKNNDKYLTREEAIKLVKSIPPEKFNDEAHIKYFKMVYEAKKKYGGDYSKDEAYLRKNGVKLDDDNDEQ